jgi:hypothetical protein
VRDRQSANQSQNQSEQNERRDCDVLDQCHILST